MKACEEGERLYIGSLSKMLGISPQTIRFYQKYGIASPRHPGDEGYRAYDFASLMSFINARKYRNCGLSVAQSRDMLLHASLADVQEMAERQADCIAEEMERLAVVQQKLRLLAAELVQARERLAKIELVTIPDRYGMYFLNHYQPLELRRQDRRLVSEWVQMLPIAEVATFYLDWEGDGRHSVLGFVMDAKDERFYRVAERKEALFIPGGRALHAIYHISSVEVILEKFYDEMLRHAAENHLRVRGLPHSRYIVSLDHSGQHPYYVNLWVPVE